MKLDIVGFAYQILEMQDKIIDLEIENNRLRKYEADYNELLNSSLNHNAAMMGNIFNLCMTPGVVEACENNKTFGDIK
jgi:hypothetical protein